MCFLFVPLQDLLSGPLALQEGLSGPLNWQEAEAEALLEWCGSQQGQEDWQLSPVPDEQLKRFLLLKNKIIDTQ